MNCAYLFLKLRGKLLVGDFKRSRISSDRTIPITKLKVELFVRLQSNGYG